MKDHLVHALTLVAYQIVLIAGIALLPVAIALKRVGITLPVHEPLRTLTSRVEAAR